MEKNNPYLIPGAVVAAGLILALTIFFKPTAGSSSSNQSRPGSASTRSESSDIAPKEGVVIPAAWGDLGQRLATSGAIDAAKFEQLYAGRGLTPQDASLLNGTSTDRIRITRENSGLLLNLFWALGLANRNPILQSEMVDPRYGGAGNFASTGGWTMADGNAMSHYGMHDLVALTTEQQDLVERVSKGIYRPCCNNSTHFPDCNHGMAMLGLLELMAAQGATEQEMWQAALAVNSYWFPDQYQTIASYMKSRGVDWKNVDPQEILGAAYSSASGYAKIKSLLTNPTTNQPQSGGCSV